MRKTFILVALLAVSVPGTVLAQDNPVQVNFGGGSRSLSVTWPTRSIPAGTSRPA